MYKPIANYTSASDACAVVLDVHTLPEETAYWQGLVVDCIATAAMQSGCISSMTMKSTVAGVQNVLADHCEPVAAVILSAGMLWHPYC